MKATTSFPEALESRIAPAMASLVIVNPGTATFDDVDGDHVTVKVSTGILTSLLFTGVAGAHGDQLQLLDLSSGGFQKANIAFTVTKVAGGDGLVNVGYINASDSDLGTVAVKGDLGRIDAGVGDVTSPAVKLLSVNSIGRLGTDTQAAGGNLTSNFNGSLGALKVVGDVKDAYISSFNSAGIPTSAITIGGSLIGSGAADSGTITIVGDVGAVKVAQNIQGGEGFESGSINCLGSLGSLSVGGSVIGGGVNSGRVLGGTGIGKAAIGKNLKGGTGADSGVVETNGKIGSITIGGSILGDDGDNSGIVLSGGDMGAVKVGHDIKGGLGKFSGNVSSNGKLTSAAIGGGLFGGDGESSGQIYGAGDIGGVKIAHDVTGGIGKFSGEISSDGILKSVAVGGSLLGGSGQDSGEIFSGSDMGTVKIGHDVRGGTGSSSGIIDSNGKLASVTIGGSLIGGSLFTGIAASTGEILSAGDMGSVKIGGDLIGGSISGTATLVNSGVIASGGRILSVAIGGSIIAGFDASTSNITLSAYIAAGDDLGSLAVKGSISGNITSAVTVSARGQHTQIATGTSDLAIGKIAVKGRVEFTKLLAGYSILGIAQNGDAQIGSIAVGGDWAASSIVAGAQNLGTDNAVGGTGTAGDNVNFADVHDLRIAPGSATIFSKIASITIKGQLFGTPTSVDATDHFGFVAEQIGTVKIGGNAIPVPTNSTPSLIGQTDDIAIHRLIATM